MSESLGARLRQQRERQQIALATIAEQTKIKLSLLEGLERDDVSRWPDGIFRRAFVRAYAHCIGLDPDLVVREFLDLHPDPIDDEATVSAAVQARDRLYEGGPPSRLRFLAGSAIGSLFRRRSEAHEKAPSSQGAAAADSDDLFEELRSSREMTTPGPEPTPAADREPPAAGIATAPVVVEPSIAHPVATDATPAGPVPAVPVADEPASVDPVLADPAPARSAPPWMAAARLCTDLAQVDEACDTAPLLEEAARILDAAGLIVWIWDAAAAALRPALAHGYSDRVLAQLPRVARDADNATAAAFRTGETCTVGGSLVANGALAVPLMTPAGCAGILAVEVQHGGERTEPVRALATILAAQLARLVVAEPPAEAAGRRLASA